jgi:hypothetical protein
MPSGTTRPLTAPRERPRHDVIAVLLARLRFGQADGEAVADAKNNIRNSTARIQNAAAFGSVLRPECSPVPGPYRTSLAAPLAGFTCSGTTNLPQPHAVLTT